jgi:hypothetical protein
MVKQWPTKPGISLDTCAQIRFHKSMEAGFSAISYLGGIGSRLIT